MSGWQDLRCPDTEFGELFSTVFPHMTLKACADVQTTRLRCPDSKSADGNAWWVWPGGSCRGCGGISHKFVTPKPASYNLTSHACQLHSMLHIEKTFVEIYSVDFRQEQF